MSRRGNLIGLGVSLVVLVLTVMVITGIGPSLPGPHVRSWLGVGGPPLPDLCEVDPARIVDPPGRRLAGTWRLEHDSPTPSPEPGAAVLDGYVYLVGGQLRTGTEKTVLRFDPRTGEYRRERDAPVAIDHPVVVAHGDEIILASGYVDGAVATNRAWAYSPRMRRWRALPRMHYARGAAAGAVIGDKLYVAGGVQEFGDEYDPYNLLEIYDFKTGRWSLGPDMPTARHHFGVGVVDGKLYFAGGRQPSDLSLDAFEEFDPSADSWRRLPPMPVGTGAPGVTAVDGRVIVAGGGTEVMGDTDEGTVLRMAYAYDPGARQWVRLPDLRRARHGQAAAAIDGRAYMFRGAPCPGYGEMSSVESLRPPPS